MSSFVAFESRWVSLADCSHSSFALVYLYFCSSEDLPPSSDVDEGYQCEVQTAEG
jgi:hypothetical protein